MTQSRSQDAITQRIAGIRRFGRDVPGGHELLGTNGTGYNYMCTAKPDIACDDHDARDGLGFGAGHRRAGPAGRGRSQDLDGRGADAYALLALVTGQDDEPVEDSDGADGRWRIARRVAPDRVFSTVGPDTRHAYKIQSRQQDGFKAHTVIIPIPG